MNQEIGLNRLKNTYYIKEENMNKFTTIIVALMLTGTVALADDNMITNKINDVSNTVKTFVVNEKEKTIAYQKKSWAEARVQLAGIFQTLSNLFNKNKEEDNNG